MAGPLLLYLKCGSFTRALWPPRLGYLPSCCPPYHWTGGRTASTLLVACPLRRLSHLPAKVQALKFTQPDHSRPAPFLPHSVPIIPGDFNVHKRKILLILTPILFSGPLPHLSCPFLWPTLKPVVKNNSIMPCAQFHLCSDPRGQHHNPSYMHSAPLPFSALIMLTQQNTTSVKF